MNLEDYGLWVRVECMEYPGYRKYGADQWIPLKDFSVEYLKSIHPHLPVGCDLYRNGEIGPLWDGRKISPELAKVTGIWGQYKEGASD